ncbi:MAG: septation protein SpoVG family protein [Candidatus Babeliales bacterium]|jgi:stage V sporulation protein G
METRVSNIQIVPIRPCEGLVGFASLVFDNSFYLGSIGIYTRPNGQFRLSYPTRKLSNQNLPVFHPIDKEIANLIDQAVISKFEEVMQCK